MSISVRVEGQGGGGGGEGTLGWHLRGIKDDEWRSIVLLNMGKGEGYNERGIMEAGREREGEGEGMKWKDGVRR